MLVDPKKGTKETEKGNYKKRCSEGEKRELIKRESMILAIIKKYFMFILGFILYISCAYCTLQDSLSQQSSTLCLLRPFTLTPFTSLESFTCIYMPYAHT